MVATTNAVDEWNTADAAAAGTEVQSRQRWLLVMSQGKTAIFDRNEGDGTEAATRTLAFTGMGLPGWGGAFFAGDLDYPDRFVLTESGGTGRLIRVLITFSAEAPTATVDTITYGYDDGLGGGYVLLTNPSGTFDAQDLQNTAVAFDYRRPRQTNVIESVAVDTDDVSQFRDNCVAQMAAAAFRGHLYTQYIGIPGATVTETPASSLTPTSIVVAWATPDLNVKYEFVYYASTEFGGTVALPRRVTMSIQKTSAEAYYTVATFDYIRKTNGMLMMIRPV